MRLFIAILLPPALRERLAAVAADLEETVPRQWRYVRPHLMHVTLRFLGEVEESRVPDVTQAVLQASKRMDAFELEVAGLGHFPNERSPRVLWAGFVTTAPLIDLVQQLETELLQREFAADSRPFVAHITLARSNRGQRSVPPLVKSKLWVSERFGPLPVNALTLVQSTLRKEGPHYEVLLDSPLGSSTGECG